MKQNLTHLSVSFLCLFAANPYSALAAPPTITSLFPAGGSRGTTVEFMAAGSVDPWPVKVEGTAGIVTPGKERGKYTVAIGADTPPGVHWFRAHNDDGASPLRPFIVGTLPEIVEAEPNDDHMQAKAIDAPGVVVNGRLAKTGDVDCFAVALKQGQTLVASVDANTALKSPMDGVLQVVSPAGSVVEQNNDHRGLDPQLSFTAPAAGTYVVRLFAFPSVPDSSIRLAGGDAFIYRLTLTTTAFVDVPTPLAVGTAGGLVSVRGWNIPNTASRVSVGDGRPGWVDLFHPRFANVQRVRREAVPCHDATAAVPKLITPPFAVTGRLEKSNTPFEVAVAGKKGQALAVRAESRAFGLDVNPVVRVAGPDGKQLARAEPAKLHADTSLSFTPPADGEYKVAVADLYGAAGPRSVFLLRVAPPEPDYELTVPVDRFAVPPDKTTDVTVKVTRRNGFSKPIEIVAEGSAGRAKFEPKAPAGKEDPNAIVLTLTGGNAKASGPLTLFGRVAGEPGLTRLVHAPNGDFDEPTPRLWLTVGDTPVSTPPPKKKR